MLVLAEYHAKNEFCKLNHTLYPIPSMIFHADTERPNIRFLRTSGDGMNSYRLHLALGVIDK
jgi:hypothetical protein